MNCDFNNEKQCTHYFKAIRWKDGVECPFCQSHSICEFKDGERFKCKECKKIFSVKVGSIFEHSRLSLVQWFKAIQILLKSSDISSIQLGKEIGVTQKTAWMMMDKIKNSQIMSNYLSRL